MDEKEWRDLIWSEIRELRSEVRELSKENKNILEAMTTLKIRLGVVVSIFTGFTTLAWNFLQKKIGE